MKYAKAVWLVAAAMLHSVPSGADYLPPTLLQLVAGSDLIVLGRIVAVDQSTFTLSVEEALVGTATDSLVEVSRFQDWACSTRWQPYAVGQREIAFLCRKGTGYRTNSPGAEGEWQITGNRVTCAYYAPPGIQSPANVLPLKSVTPALKDFGACVRIDSKPPRVEGGLPLPPEYRRIIEVCDYWEQILALATRSEMHKYLVETLRATYTKGGYVLCSCCR
jgi:hypothetical protein